jgi:hypothetical protein
MVKDVEHFFILLLFFLTHLHFFLWKSSVQFICHFFTGPLIFGSIVFWAPCKFWLLAPFQMYSWERFFPILWTVSLIWWLFVLLCKRYLVFMQSYFSIFFLSCWAIWVLSKKCFSVPIISIVFPALSYTSFKVSGLIMFLNPLWVDFIQGEKHRSSFSFLYAEFQFSQKHLLKRLSVVLCIFWVPFTKIG